MAEDRTGAKSYDGERISVSFDSARCLHYAECVRGLPAVFDSGRRPWIDPDGAAEEDVAKVVRRCPSGALQYRLTEGADEAGEAITVLRRTPEGRIELRGEINVEVIDSDGSVRHSRETRLVACGCGRSAQGFFCDGTCTR